MSAQAVEQPEQPRPGAGRAPRSHVPDTGWMLDAECIDAPPAVSEQMTGAEHRDDVAELAELYCRGCAVLGACESFGRRTKAYGLWGGVVLRHGRLARRLADPALEVVREPPDVVPEQPETTRSGGQRRQPRRLPRSKRRRSRLVGRVETVCATC